MKRGTRANSPGNGVAKRPHPFEHLMNVRRMGFEHVGVVLVGLLRLALSTSVRMADSETM